MKIIKKISSKLINKFLAIISNNFFSVCCKKYTNSKSSKQLVSIILIEITFNNKRSPIMQKKKMQILMGSFRH